MRLKRYAKIARRKLLRIERRLASIKVVTSCAKKSSNEIDAMKNWRERQRGKKGKIRRNGNREVGGGGGKKYDRSKEKKNSKKRMR